MFNLRESVSKEEAQRYVELFEPSERKQMWAMMVFIKQKGKDEAYKFVTRGLEFVDD